MLLFYFVISWKLKTVQLSPKEHFYFKFWAIFKVLLQLKGNNYLAWENRNKKNLEEIKFFNCEAFHIMLKLSKCFYAGQLKLWNSKSRWHKSNTVD